MMVTVPTPIRNEIATVPRDPWNPASHLPFLLPLDDTLVSRGGGKSYRIYDELERDGRLYSAMRKRKMALLAYPWQLNAASDAPADMAARDLVEAHLKALNFSAMCLALQDAILKGYAVGEIMWQVVDGYVAPVDVKPRDQRRFTFDLQSNLRMRTWENMYQGIELPDRKFVVHTVGSKDGSPFGWGLGSILFWYVLFKRQDITFWLTFLDKFGSPTPVGKYAPGTSPEDQEKLLKAMMSLAQDSAIIIPDNVQLDLLEGQRSGSIDAYESACRYFDEEITITILGETLSTSIDGGGSRAASQTHNDVRLELVQSDGELLADTLNRTLIAWDTAINFADAKPPVLEFVVDQGEDLNQRAQRDVSIASMGFKPSLNYITNTYGGEWTEVAAPAPMPGDGLGDGTAFAEAPARAAQQGDKTVDGFAARLGDAADAPIGAMVDHVRLMMQEVGSLEEARDQLLDLYPKLDHAAFAEVMQQGLSASAGAGAFAAKK